MLQLYQGQNNNGAKNQNNTFSPVDCAAGTEAFFPLPLWSRRVHSSTTEFRSLTH